MRKDANLKKKRLKDQFDWKMTTECVDASSQPVHTKLIRINPIDIERPLMNIIFPEITFNGDN